MGWLSLYPHQEKALPLMHNGCILCGGVGSGKSREAIAYYFIQNGGDIGTKEYTPMKDPEDLYIITIAKKRDNCEWEGELSYFLMSTDPEGNLYKHKIIIDSWNNISKYVKVKNSFFIFDEQRVVGYGTWTKSFLKIVKNNHWIMLSATPGDCWKDYIPVFLANGFYRTKSEFEMEHIIYRPRVKFPQILRYVNTNRLIRLRNKILVPMEFERHTIEHHETVHVDYDYITYKFIGKERKDPFKDNKPIETASALCYAWRRVVNSDPSRAKAIIDIFKEHPRVIIFYNFNYELDILKSIDYGEDVAIAEWNSHKHEEIPNCKSWVYLVQYNAGSEGWNCIKTDTTIYYSQNYSYKLMEQASGRINRLNTPYIDLYYYHLKSGALIDLAISSALNQKKKFNEGKFASKFERKG